MQTKQDQTGLKQVTICQEKHKLTLYKTQNGVPNQLDHTIFFNLYYELPVQNLGDRYPNTTELANWLVHVLYDFKAT